jgi:iron complex transport system ATP-binding protein
MNRTDFSSSLEARNVSFSYRRRVVSNVTLALTPGTVTGIMGPNGSGKTTILRLLGGLLQPDSGSILLHGTKPLSGLPRKEIARYIAMVPQSPGDGSQLTVMHFAMQGRYPHLSLFGFESARDEEITKEALEMTQLTRYREARVCELSGGERQRLLLARALAQESQILLVDELTANLDINYQIELIRLVKHLTQERRLATLVVSHEIHLLGSFADRIALMSEGAIRCQGTVSEVVTRENLNRLFGLDFHVRPAADGLIEILPVINQRRRS